VGGLAVILEVSGEGVGRLNLVHRAKNRNSSVLPGFLACGLHIHKMQRFDDFGAAGVVRETTQNIIRFADHGPVPQDHGYHVRTIILVGYPASIRFRLRQPPVLSYFDR
jgi:hypothetical protein